jgi:long-chain acyl-CoA synthetase
MKRPFLICPNHQSFLDPFVLCSNYSYDFFRSTFHVGASEFFQNGFMRWLSRMLNVVPIDPDTQLMKAMKAGATGLKHGKILNIYPEGERAFDGDLHDFKKGAAILAEGLGLPVLPVAIDGTYKVWPRRSWRIRPAKVKINFGEPFYAKDIIDAPLLRSEQPRRSGALSDTPAVEPSNTGAAEVNYEAVRAHLKQVIKTMIDQMRNV